MGHGFELGRWKCGMDLSWGGGDGAWLLVGEVGMGHGFELGRCRCGIDLSWAGG